MTKRIKARKRWLKGRGRLPGTREPNGRLSRRKVHQEARDAETSAKEKAENMETGVAARMRLFGLSEAKASQQEAGSVVGRMLIGKQLNQDQYDASRTYLEARNAYHRSQSVKPDTGVPPAPPAWETGRGDFEGFCEGAKARWHGIKQAVQQACLETRSQGPAVALDTIVVHDQHVPHLVGDLRIALNALHRINGVGERSGAPLDARSQISA
jgi:hypothetical protein